ncbi:MAG TPA: hypothetical protein VKV27_15710 [Solirubrobacteraceae bacterium]|nr:hypothetical protein [Solirubrobacteraceae bacterium]
MTVAEIVENIDTRLAALSGEIARLAAAREALVQTVRDTAHAGADGRARAGTPGRPPGAPSARDASPERFRLAEPTRSLDALDSRSGGPDSRSGAPGAHSGGLRHIHSGRPRPSDGRRRSPRATARTGRRSAGKALGAEAVERLLAETGGDSASGLARRSGASRAEVLAALRQLESAGRARRTGDRRTTRWLLISDEELIRARAAELAALSRSRRPPEQG